MRRKGIGHVYFVSGGSEAIEAALKLARQYFVERGEPQRRYLIARPPELSRHHARRTGGRRPRMAAQAVRAAPDRDAPCFACATNIATGAPMRRRRPMASASPPNSRPRFDELGGDNVIAFVAETVVGATVGAVPAVAGYFKRVREICDRHGILLILDEVMCGMGRTGTLHACEQEGDQPRPDGDRKGPRRRFCADRRAAAVRARSSRRSRKARARSSTATPTWVIRSPARRRSLCKA